MEENTRKLIVYGKKERKEKEKEKEMKYMYISLYPDGIFTPFHGFIDYWWMEELQGFFLL